MDLAFLVDICNFLNKINLKLQGKNKNIFEMLNTINYLKLSIERYISCLENNNFSFLNNSFNFLTNMNIKKYIDLLKNFYNKIKERFSFSYNIDIKIQIIGDLNSVNLDLIDENLANEILLIKASDCLFSTYKCRENKLNFFKENISKENYPYLHKIYTQVLSMFGSTYMCEKTFSKMKIIKSKLRNLIGNENLTNQLGLATTTIKIDLDELLNN